MGTEELEVRNRFETLKSAGTSIGQMLAGMINRLELQGHFDTRPADEDADLIEQMLEQVMGSPHVTKKHGEDYHNQDVMKAAARNVFAVDFVSAARDLRFAERAFMDHFYFDHLEDMEADDRATARAS